MPRMQMTAAAGHTAFSRIRVLWSVARIKATIIFSRKLKNWRVGEK
jgi:hypothetical protein